MLPTALLLLAVVRLLRSPDLWSAALVGAAGGALALTRAELVLFLPALLIFFLIAAPWHFLVNYYNPEFFHFYFIE